MKPPFTIHADGCCEPSNPGGYACWGWVALDGDGAEIATGSGCIGHGPAMTNNLAEYRAVIEALRWAYKAGIVGAAVQTDSLLVVKQVNGEWQCTKPHLLELRESAVKGLALTGSALVWIPREQNERADALSRQAYAEAVASQRRNGA